MSFFIEKEVECNFNFDYEKVAEAVVSASLEHESFPYEAEVNLTLTDNEGIHAINKEYRQIDRPTDVLSFALNEGDEPIIKGGPAINVLGDIVISVEKAAEQAEEYGHGIRREIAFLVTHGMLHLLGYDHIKEEDRIKMRKEEDFVMEKIGILR